MSRIPNFTRLAARGVRELEPYVPGKPLEDLEREYGIRDAIKLASNENPLGPSPRALEAMRVALGDVALYPDGSAFRLRHALATQLGVAPDQVTIGNGSNELLVLLAETFLGPRVEAVYSEYAFLVYKLAVQATGARARVAPAYSGSHEQPLGHDLDAFRAAIGASTRLVFIANPNNPTGTWIEAEALRRFLEGVPPQVIVVVDEAYREYVDGADFPDTVSWLDRWPNLVVTRTFSKIYGLAGARIGYAVSHPALARLLNQLRQPFNVNGPAQAGAIAALADEAHVARSREVNASGMVELTEGLRQLGVGVARSAANFVLADLGRPAAPVYEALLRVGVIARPVANYGLPRHLRITVGLPAQNRRLLGALAGAMAAEPPA
jgi:histidinol-phosphate aminotransferase